jgi:hypothetical protein
MIAFTCGFIVGLCVGILLIGIPLLRKEERRNAGFIDSYELIKRLTKKGK